MDPLSSDYSLTQHGLNAMTPPSPPVPGVPAGYIDQYHSLFEVRARYLYTQGFHEYNNAEYAQIMQIIKGSDLQRQQHLQHPSIQLVSSAQQASYPYRECLPLLPPPPQHWQQMVMAAPPPAFAMQDGPIFSNIQLEALKNQIFASKLLLRNMPVPRQIMQAVLSPLPPVVANYEQLPPTPIEEATAATGTTEEPQAIIVVSPPMTMSSLEPSTSPLPRKGPQHVSKPSCTTTTLTSPKIPTSPVYDGYLSPYGLFPKPITSYSHATRQHRQLVPSVLPVGVDLQMCVQARECDIQQRMQNRVEELSRGSMVMASSQHHNDTTAPAPFLKSLIELKSLKLADRQKQLRQELVHSVERFTTKLITGHRATIHRAKRSQSIRDARMVDRMERQQFIDRRKRKEAARAQQLQAIQQRVAYMLDVQRVRQARKASMSQAVLHYHQFAEREELRRFSRISRERMRALKNDDQETYIKLVDKTKDMRLTQLVQHTDTFLQSLATAVLSQQQNSGFSYGSYLSRDDEGGSMGHQLPDCFKVAHGIQEDVRQPHSLVGGLLKKYQLKGLQWMVSLYNNRLNGILADEMGLGKTIQTIALIAYLTETKRINGPFLIILPVSTMTNWVMEFDKWAPSVTKIVYKGRPEERKAMQTDIRCENFQVLLTSYDFAMHAKDRPVLSRINWLYVIVDEGHRIKNTHSKLTVTLRRYYRSRHRLILSGTPLQNNLTELWSLLNFILPRMFKSVQSFEEWFSSPFKNHGIHDVVDLNEEEQLLIIKRLQRVLRPFLLRRLKQDVESELPNKIERVIKCKLSALQTKLIQQIQKQNGLYLASSDKKKTRIKRLSNTLMQLRKVCNHPFAFKEIEHAINPSRESNELLFRVSGKFELLDRILPKLRLTNHKVLIFFQMTDIMNIMEDYMHFRGYSYLRLDGATKSDDRAGLLKAFSAADSPYFVFLLSTRAGGLGINLQMADTVILFDSDWNPHQDLQAQDRARRIGQAREVLILRLVSTNSVEERILARANVKLDMDGRIIQTGKFDRRNTDEDREAFLRALLEDKDGEPGEEQLEGEDHPDDEELNAILKRSEQDMAIFQGIDAERERNEIENRRRRGSRPANQRLIQEHELPTGYHGDVLSLALERTEIARRLGYGRGQRVKDSVQYDDGLTEEEWLKRVAQATDEEVKHEQAQSPEPVPSLKRKRSASTTVHGNVSRSRKRERTANAVKDRKKQLADKEELALRGPDPLPPSLRQELTRIFEICYQAVEDATEVEEDEETILYRKRSDLFMELVDENQYPIYYTTIKEPIALSIIKRRIHSPYYKSIADFRHDFHIMFDNARVFNEEDSVVYKDANEMQKLFDSMLIHLCPQDVPPSMMVTTGGMSLNDPSVYQGSGVYPGSMALLPGEQPLRDNSQREAQNVTDMCNDLEEDADDDDDDDDNDADYYDE